MLFRPKMLMSVSALALCTVTSAALAADDQVLETIVVTGMRSSLTSAAGIKRNAEQVQDSVVAEDLGKMPDTNIAETLQRIPGVQIARNTRGEGNSYIIHGLSQVMTTVNGRELFGTSDRSAHLLDFSSDILSGVDVFKTATADQIEGGLGGLINAHTAHPFDYEGSHAALTVAENYSEFQDRAGPRLSGAVSDRWDTGGAGEFGLLLGGQWEHVYSGGYQTSTNAYADSKALFDVNNNGIKNEAADNVTLPTQVRPRYETGYRLRAAAYASAQWKISDFEFFVDYLFAHSGGHSFTQQFQVRTDGATGVGVPAFKSGTTVATNYTLSNPQIRSSTSAYDNPYETYNLAFGGSYNKGPLHVNAQGSLVRSSGPFYARTVDLTGRGVTGNVNLVDKTPDMTVSGTDITLPSTYTTMSYSEYGTYQYGREPSFRIDASYDLDAGPLKSLLFGGRWSQHKAVYDWIQPPASSTASQTISNVTELTPAKLFTNQTVGINQWLAFDADIIKSASAVRTLFGLAAADVAPTTANHYDLMETIWAGYGETKFGFDLFSLPVDGNLGLRYVNTSTKQTVPVASGSTYVWLTGATTYGDFLPSANIRVSFTDDLFWRVAFSKAIYRPDYSNLSPAVSTNTNGTGSGGNPDLRPTKADQYDTSLEYYFGPSNYVALSVFWKQVNGFVQKFAINEDINGVTYLVTRPRNSGGGNIDGFELTYQQFFDFLPGALSGLGVQGNYTFIDSALKQYGYTYKIPANLLSKNSYNITAIYEKDDISVHVSYNWRSHSLQSISTTWAATQFNRPLESLDVSGTYQLNDHLSVKADVVNALASYQYQYYGLDTGARPVLANQLDRSYQISFHANY